MRRVLRATALILLATLYGSASQFSYLSWSNVHAANLRHAP